MKRGKLDINAFRQRIEYKDNLEIDPTGADKLSQLEGFKESLMQMQESLKRICDRICKMG